MSGIKTVGATETGELTHPVAGTVLVQQPDPLLSPRQQFVLSGVDWKSYELILAALPEHRLRHAYDNGVLELMSPSALHDRTKRMLGRLIEAISMIFGIPIVSMGSTTQTRSDLEKGLEPDESYYVQHELAMRDKRGYEPGIDPPPDLAIEIDVTSSSVKRMPIYAALGVLEIWRYVDDRVEFHARMADGRYQRIDRSLAFPFLTSADATAFLSKPLGVDESTWVQSFVKDLKRRVDSSN